MTLNALRAALRNGKPLKELGEYLGCSWTVAYKVGPFAVKELGYLSGTGLHRETQDSLSLYEINRRISQRKAELAGLCRARNVRLAPTVVVKTVNGVMLIQMCYKHLDQGERHAFRTIDRDVHGGNVGHDHRGRLVAFDW